MLPWIASDVAVAIKPGSNSPCPAWVLFIKRGIQRGAEAHFTQLVEVGLILFKYFKVLYPIYLIKNINLFNIIMKNCPNI